MNSKHCIVIAGATATGKSDLALDLALKLETSILSADSRQCFKELNIGVAKPPVEMLGLARHFFINSHSIHEPITAADFESYGLAALQEIFKGSDHAVVVGGTGLYINALLYGFDVIPRISDSIREEIISNYASKGKSWLIESLKVEDALFAAKGEMQNPQRMMRALEVIRGTGKSILSFKTNSKKQRPFHIHKFQLVQPRDVLYSRISNRVDAMMDAGLYREAAQLFPFKHLNALQTVGYREIFEEMEGKIALSEAIDLIKKNTRHYAKRQITWFNKDLEMMPITPGQSEIVLKALRQE